MSDKLNQSLDTILSERRKSGRNTRAPRAGRRTATSGRPAVAPVGGVKKNTRPAKTNEKATATAVAAKVAAKVTAKGESKIIVSGLPFDVNEAQTKDYFGQTIGPVKRVMLTYGPNGQSRGIATIIFNQPTSAAKAAKDLNGVTIDNRPMKIEVIVGAKEVPALSQPKKLSERVSQPKGAANAKPKPATDGKAGKTAAGKKGARGGKAGRARGGKPAGVTKKTAEELDQEMADYFVGGTGGDAAMVSSGGAVQPATETAMDEVL